MGCKRQVLVLSVIKGRISYGEPSWIFSFRAALLFLFPEHAKAVNIVEHVPCLS
jgi:hypothetical protein